MSRETLGVLEPELEDSVSMLSLLPDFDFDVIVKGWLPVGAGRCNWLMSIECCICGYGPV